MTAITILAFGTRGDVVPFTGLGARIRDSLNATVTIAAQSPYQQLILDAGLLYKQLPHDTEQATRDSLYGQAMIDGEKLRPSREALAGMRDDLVGVGEAMAVAAENADLVLCAGPVGSMLGWHVAEALGVASAAVFLQPSTPTGHFAPPALTTRSYGRLGNRAAWVMVASGEKFFTPLIDDLRATLGLPHRSRRSYQQLRAQSWPQIYGFSNHVVPRPSDWPPNAYITGYWWPCEPTDYSPPAALVDFLGAGSPPIYVGLGSSAITYGEEFSRTITDALRQTGQRGVFHRGWAHLDGLDAPHVYTVDDTPHSWLLPKMAAAAHHCGAGTTAAALRAGIPTIALPGIMDQPFWAERLHRLGVSHTPLRRIGLTSEEIAKSMITITTDPAYRRAADTISGYLAAENGEQNAVDIIEKLLTSGRA